jgi:hypothetical protein
LHRLYGYHFANKKEKYFMTDSLLTPEVITLYGTGWCPDCKRSKQFFGEQCIPYHPAANWSVQRRSIAPQMRPVLATLLDSSARI